MENLIKPKALKKGDSIGLVSPSSPLAGQLPHRVEQGKKMLEEMGFKVVIGKNALKVKDWTAGTARERADDLNTFFADKNIKAIIAFIGGFHSNQIVELLDYKMIKKNPKVFMGYSDITVLHFALNTQANLMTFYGPAVLTQFADNPSLNSYTEEYFEKAVTSNQPIGEIRPSTEWTDEVLNWIEKKDLERPRIFKKNPGWIWLKEGQAKGKLIGGCLSSMLHLRSIKYWPDFENKIFFWEIPESSADFSKGEPLSEVDAHLTDLKLSDIFKQIKGMIIGRPFGYNSEQFRKLKQLILEYTATYDFPVLFGIDIGHTDPMLTLPLGVNAQLNSAKNLFVITEKATD